MTEYIKTIIKHISRSLHTRLTSDSFINSGKPFRIHSLLDG